MLNNLSHSISISQGGLIISLFECCISYLVRVSLIALACCRLWMFLHRTKTPRVKLGHSLFSVPASPVSTVPVLSGCNLQFITIYPAQPAQPSQPSPAQPGAELRSLALGWWWLPGPRYVQWTVWYLVLGRCAIVHRGVWRLQAPTQEGSLFGGDTQKSPINQLWKCNAMQP